MYKLFLTLRYLTRRKIVIFPILVVWLCVMMLVIVSSIMGGFVDRVKETNHELLGDIVITSPSFAEGFARYDELQKALKADKELGPLIQASTPTVEVYGLVHIPEYQDSRAAVLEGIDPVGRSQVTKFRESLFNEYQAPVQAVDDLAPHLPATQAQLVEAAGANAEKVQKQFGSLEDESEKLELKQMTSVVKYPLDYWWLIAIAPAAGIVACILLRARRTRSVWGGLVGSIAGIVFLAVIVLGLFWPVMFPRQLKLVNDAADQAYSALNQAERTLQFAQSLPAGNYTTREQLAKAIVPPVPNFDVPAAMTQPGPTGQPGLPADGCIIGSEMGFFRRNRFGNFEHGVNPRYTKVIVTVFPANQKTGGISVNANNSVQRGLTMVDDSHSGVFDVDQMYTYADFNLVQQLAGLDADPQTNTGARAQEILIRLTPEAEKGDLVLVRAKVGRFVRDFQDAHADVANLPLEVQTWDEKQARYLGAVQNERVMVIFCIGLMSLVVLVVIFLIFYQIVRDKTRDIGIIKAVGGSEAGVAGIFITFGLFIGLVGGGMGDLCGWLFVTHTNQIHELIFHATGIVIWDRSVYLFDRIPDTVDVRSLIVFFVVAVWAGVVGALFPAIVASYQDPVEAVRYE